jgi:hypothetical protein
LGLFFCCVLTLFHHQEDLRAELSSLSFALPCITVDASVTAALASVGNVSVSFCMNCFGGERESITFCV